MPSPAIGISSELQYEVNEFFSQASNKQLQNRDAVLSKQSSVLLGKLQLTKMSPISLAERELIDSLIAKITTASQSLAWEELPKPEFLTLALKNLAEVTAALQLVLENFLPDILDVMKELIAINGKQQLQKMREALFNFTNQVLAAQAQFSETAAANQKQKEADWVQAGFQLGGAVINIASSSYGVGMSKSVIKSSRDQLNQLKICQAQKLKAKTDIKQFQEQLEDVKKQRLADPTGTKKNAIDQEENKILDGLTLAKESLKNATLKEKKIFHRLEHLNKKSSLIQSASQLIGAFSGVANAAGGFGSAQLKADSSKASLDSQKDEFFKNLSQNFSQDAIDRYRAIKDAIDSALQAVRTIMQAIDSSISKSV